MRVPLPEAFLATPIAHRALHDRAAGRPENSRAAIRAAVAAGYGIEIDLQLSADGVAMVFHDEDLARLTGIKGWVRDRSAAELSAIRLIDAEDGIPTLAEVLRIVDGRVPLLIEIKDPTLASGPDVGKLPARVAEVLAGYQGPVAVMSFNPHVIAAFHKAAPDIAVGLTTCAYEAGEWPMLDAATREHLASIADFDDVGASFISHDRADLENPAVTALKARGVPVLCWTIQSPAQEMDARRIADNITFEQYRPEMP